AYSFKGFELAQQLYGDLALRHSNDIDMLVKPEHYERARVVLADIGFTSSTLDDFPPYFIDRLRLATKDFTFNHNDGTI
ncbi:MAG: nucleotidyltransferase family protein, partial [Photobacterium frigidiphilum]|uniref:nucleotidyltransferase family protein n=1 Tax=Photobacterium frigidiphilum TaxID=264736 RepID=UPI003002C47E